MSLFKRKQRSSSEQPAPAFSYSQLDSTEAFGDNAGLEPDAWLPTVPLNTLDPAPEEMGLPSLGASPDEVFRIASKLSRVRESIPELDDGVYCAICHIANADITKLRTPCPQCGRELLQFGWE